MILKNIRRRKIRSILTILGIGIGVMAIVALGSMTEGIEVGYGSMLTGSKADLVLTQPDAYDISLSSVDEAIGAELSAMPEVHAVSGMLQGWATTENEPFFFVFGYPEDSFVLERFQVSEGSSLDSREARTARGNPLILGSAAAEVMEKQPGDRILVSGSLFRVMGIYETGDALEDAGAVMFLEDAQELLGKPRLVSLFYIQLRDPSLGERFITRMERRYPDLLLSGTDEFSDEQAMADYMGAFVWVIGGLAILIGGVGMMNAQLMSIYERTREIGVLRAVGWGSLRVLGMILGESVLVSVLGGVLGLGLGWLVLTWLSRITNFLGLIDPNLSAQILLQVFMTVFILGLVGGLYPAWHASRLPPVEALRYEGGSTGSKVRRLPVGGMAVQSIWQRSTRTLLTLGVIGITVGALMALQATVDGTLVIFEDLFSGAEIMLRQANISDTSLSVIDEQVVSRIETLQSVQIADGMIFTAVMMPEAGTFFLLFGLEPNGLNIQRYRIAEGETLQRNHQVILGRLMANALNKKVGNTIELSGTRFRIVGIYESQVGFEEMGGVITLRDAQVLSGKPRQVTMVSIKVNEADQADEIVARINREYPDIHAALAGDFVDQMPDMQSMDAMMVGISGLAILIGGVGVLNAMLMAVFERTREIGVLRSLGWRRRRILDLIMREALWLGLLGGVVGILIAFGLVGLFKINPLTESLAQPIWSVNVFIRAIGIALLLGLIGGLYPALRATRLEPVEALRYE